MMGKDEKVYEAFKDKNIGLALSGGGHRAAVFHLGILSYLADNDLLDKVHHISTVSGGSVVTALVYKLNGYKFPTSKEYKEIVLPQLKEYFTDRSLQSRFTLNSLWYSIIDRHKALSYTLKHNWGIDSCLQDTEAHPLWTINTTTLETGKSWQIEKRRMGDYKLGYIKSPKIDLSDAVAASAGFPFGVGPMSLKTATYNFKPKGFEKEKHLLLYDGGVYDNLGLEPLVKQNFSKLSKEIDFLLVSDASKPLLGKKTRYFKRASRLMNVSTEQIRSLKKRLFMKFLESNSDKGLYIRIGEESYGLVGEAGKAKEFGTSFKKMSKDDFDSIKSNGYSTAMSEFENFLEG